MAKVKELTLAEKIKECQGCTITVNLLGVLEGPHKTLKTDLIPHLVKYTVIDRKTNKPVFVAKTVEINHRDRLHKPCTRHINLQPFQIKAMTEDCPNSVNPGKWKSMPFDKRFALSASLFDEGYGIEVEFIL